MKLGSDGRFQPDNPAQWKGYRYTIEPDNTQNLRMFVHIPLAGRERKVMFDTCGGYGLIVHPLVWKQVSDEFGKARLTDGRFITGFQGFLPCRKGSISRLELAGRTVSDAQIIIPDESTSYLGSVEAIVSMAYFKDTTIVVDNIRHLMWVKN
jgi:hypothetical protein